MQNIEENPLPAGELALQTIAMPANTNANGDIFGGWLVSQMDLAAAILAGKIAKGRVATVAINDIAFMRPVYVGAVVSCHAEEISIGHSSIEINVEVWIPDRHTSEPSKVCDGTFVFVAIDNNGRTRKVPE